MTKEELLKKIDFEKSWLYDCGIFGSDVDIAFHAIKNSVIEALEQERSRSAEITQYRYDCEKLMEENERLKKALEQEPKFVVKSDGTIEQIKNCNDCLLRKEWEKIGKLLSVVLEKQTEQESVLDKLDEIITDALDKSTDQKESQTLRWVLDKISEVQYE